MTRSRQLVDFISDLRYEALPDQVVSSAQRCLVDHIAAALIGSRQPWSMIIKQYVRELGLPPKSTVYGESWQTGPEFAARVNGTMAHGYELDDVNRAGTVHPGAIIIPACLAVAEARHLSGKQLILGIVAGYEVLVRISRALGPGHSFRGFHTTGIAGPFGSGAGVGKLLGYGGDQLLNTFGIAASLASGIKAFVQGTGGMVKRYHAGHQAENGVVAANLTGMGYEAPMDVLEGEYGFLPIFSQGDAFPEALALDLGDCWYINDTYFKPFSSCAITHSGIQGVLELKEQYRFSAEDVTSVEIGGIPRLKEQNSNPRPANVMAAQYSMEFCVAMALLGKVRDPKSFSAESMLDSDQVRDLIDRVSIVTDPFAVSLWPATMAASVRVRLHSGQEYSKRITDPPGSPSRPMTDGDLAEKLRLLGQDVLSGEAMTRILSLVASLPETDDAALLCGALSGQ